MGSHSYKSGEKGSHSYESGEKGSHSYESREKGDHGYDSSEERRDGTSRTAAQTWTCSDMMDKCDRQWDGYNWRKYYYCYEMIKNTHWYSCEWGEQKRMENTMGYI